MSVDSLKALPAAELQTVRELARRVRDIAANPLNQDRIRLWTRLNDLDPERPMILAEVGGVRDEVLPDSILTCEHPLARGLERDLRTRIWNFETLRDDRVISGEVEVGWRVNLGGYGVESPLHRGDNSGKLGSYVWEAPLQELPEDLDKLSPRQPSVDREGTFQHRTQVEEVLDGILPVAISGRFWWTMGLTWSAIKLVGLEELMVLMMDEPEGVHALMAFLRDDHLAVAEWCEREELLTLNNGPEYIGSGSVGYTTALPQAGHPGGRVARLRDLWGLSESQETVGVSPRMFGEFIFPYQQAVIERFGLCYYGCCEPVEARWAYLRQLGNLRKLSVSPWSDQRDVAAKLGRDYVFCRKPNPAYISSAQWDEDLLRRDLAETAEIAKDCVYEVAMKDVHTVANEPWRLARWVELAREACGA